MVRWGGVDELVPGFDVLTARVIFHLVADDAALGGGKTGRPEPNSSGEAEQVELRTEFAMIAALGLLEEFEVAVEGLL